MGNGREWAEGVGLVMNMRTPGETDRGLNHEGSCLCENLGLLVGDYKELPMGFRRASDKFRYSPQTPLRLCRVLLCFSLFNLWTQKNADSLQSSLRSNAARYFEIFTTYLKKKNSYGVICVTCLRCPHFVPELVSPSLWWLIEMEMVTWGVMALFKWVSVCPTFSHCAKSIQ